MNQRSAERSPPWRFALAMAIWVGVVGSLIEVASLALERRVHPLMKLSDDFVWMAPAGLVVVTFLASIPGLLVGRFWSRRTGVALVVFASSSLVVLDLLMLVPRLSHYAAAVLAAGAAVQIARLIVRNPLAAGRLMRSSAPVLLGVCVVVGGGAWLSSRRAASNPIGGHTGSPPPRAPNVLLITLDTVRAANLGLYGYPRPTTPNLERIARRGVVFDRAFAAAPWTLPSHASLFTGRWPHELSTDYISPLDGTYPTLAEYLSTRGYATAGFVANLGYCSVETGLGRGFSSYEDYPRSAGQLASSSTLLRNVADNLRLRRALQNDQHLNRVDAADLNRRVLAWLSDHGDTPFFAFVNYFDAHEPYLPPSPFDTRFGPGRARGQFSPLHHWLWDVSTAHRAMTQNDIVEEVDAYDGAIAYLDEQVGNLLDGLAQRHVLENTLVIITADHGEEFGEHAVFDHGYSLYQQALHVPLIVLPPGTQVERARVTAAVSLRDVPATILDAIGLAAGAVFPGESLAALWKKGPASDDPPSRPLLSEVSRASGQPEWFPASKGDMKAVLYRGFHYIRNGDGSEELYDIERDLEEHVNVVGHAQFQARLVESRRALQELLENRPGGVGRIGQQP